MKKIKQFEKITIKKLKEFDDKIKTSFVLIRQDVDEMQKTIDAIENISRKKIKNILKRKKGTIKSKTNSKEMLMNLHKKLAS